MRGCRAIFLQLKRISKILGRLSDISSGISAFTLSPARRRAPISLSGV